MSDEEQDWDETMENGEAEAEEDVEVEEEEEEEEEEKPKSKKGKKGKADGKGKKEKAEKGSKNKKASPSKRKAAADDSGGGSSSKKARASNGSATPSAAAASNDPKEQVRLYMRQQNRPYTPLVVYENLHHAIKKPALQRLMDELVEEGALQVKEFKKTKLYMAKQDVNETVDQGELDQLASEEGDLKENLAQQKSKNAKLQAAITALQNEPSDEELAALLKQYQKKVDELNAKLARTKGSKAPLVTKDQVNKVQTQFNNMLSAWRKRKRAAMDMIDAMCGEEGEPKAVIERLNLETDEDVEVNLKEWTPLQKEVKLSRK